MTMLLVWASPAAAAAGDTTRESVASDGTQGDAPSVLPSISADGRYVAFESSATNLVAGDTNGVHDIFVRDTQNDTTTRVSVASDGTQGNSTSRNPAISGDGRYIAFESFATNLVPSDTSGQIDVFVHDMQTGTTTKASVNSDEVGANSTSHGPSLSADGSHVVFDSFASNLAADDTNGLRDVFVRDLVAGTTERVSVASDGSQATGGESVRAAISANDRYVAFGSFATNLVEGDTNGAGDLFLRDLLTDTTTRLSVATDGTQADGASTATGSSPGPLPPAISSDGSRVAFWSAATNLVTGDTNGHLDVFVRDTVAATTTRVSVASDGSQGNHSSGNERPSISGDGRYVAFLSFASNLVTGDTNGQPDIFVRDTAEGATARVSVASDGTQGSGGSGAPWIAGDARYVAFDSAAPNLVTGDTNGQVDVFVHDFLGSGNAAPVAADDAYTVAEDSTLSVPAPGVLTNDTDTDDDPLTAILVTGVSNGTLTLNADGSFTYTPASGFSGTDGFAYKANDGTADSNTATVAITVEATEPTDVDPPTITITTPADGASYALGATVPADYSCDDGSGSGVASCVGTVADGAAIDTSTTGQKTFTVEAVDNEGNQASLTHTYSVVDDSGTYEFDGFFPPIKNLPAMNTIRAGSSVPVKFSLGGDHGLDIFAEGYPKSQEIPCVPTAVVDGTEETATAGSSVLSYDAEADQYTYVWQTDESWSGTCRQLIVKLDDGSEHRASFILR